MSFPDIPASVLNLNLLFVRKVCTDIAWRLICDTGVISLARFPACGAIIVGVKQETKCQHLDDLGFALIWWEDIFTAIRSEMKSGKLTNNNALFKLC